MEKLQEVLQSRKFWALVSSLVAIYFGFVHGASVELSVEAAVAALAAYSLGTAIAG